ncbi:pentatricopeptide repeat-containing protein At4g14050, mitochondrial isoform X2 [Ipomoea triloba]|nr:pentatricopeptide repeat-containing protein At4g14050, mitochondrial isoform X2 [Ipomoea triloba]
MPRSCLIHQLQQCARRQAPLQGKKLHALILKTGLDQCAAPFLSNGLIDMYGKCRLPGDALQVFDEMTHRDLASWASIFTAHNIASLPRCTLSIFPNMSRLDGFDPDHFVFASLVKACANLSDLRIGKQVHAQFILSHFSGDDVVKSSLVDMYAKCGVLDLARAVFDSSLFRNSISSAAMISGYARHGRQCEAMKLFRESPARTLFMWTALISGMVQSGHLFDAFNLFIEMRKEGVEIEDPYIFSSMIGASASLVALDLGKQVHGLVIGYGYECSLFVSNALVDMYSKCTDILAAKTIFDGMVKRDVVSWTSIIVGMAQHGKAYDALSLYDEMILAGMKPNEVTFMGLIYACSHVGLVERGRSLFNSMTGDYGLNPSLQHYTCLLDLLSRSGLLDEAENLLNTMPFEPDEAAWAALLSACKRHGNTEMGVRVANRILNLGPTDPSTCILLSNIYAGAGMWENVSKLRKLMATMEVKKEPAYSCIDLGKESPVFYAGESSFPLKDEIFSLLRELDSEMRRRGYTPDTTWVLHDMDRNEKERQLFWHSERLAVAYGLLKSVPGAVIRVVKNLRVCGDCHTVLKLISGITNRRIVVRDATRFHHFKDGRCSCNDFW